MCLTTVVLMLLTTCFSSSAGSLTSTPPANLTTSVWTVGLDQLILTGTAQITLGSSQVVFWNVNGTYAIVFQSPDSINPSVCKGTVTSTFGEANCSLQGNIVTTSFKFTALTSTLLVALSNSGVDQSATIQVAKCPSVLSHGVKVTGTSFSFGSSGTFSCPSNSEIFYSNGTSVTSSSAQTQCLADATWSQQENLECWNAPSVKLYPENILGNESDTMSLSCQAIGGFPSPYFYELVVINNATAKPSSNISVTLKREWNQQEIYCRAITNYTAFNDKGKSSLKKMNVQYDPYTNQQPTVCTFYVSGNSPPCKVNFYSNPPTYVYNLAKDGLITTNDEPHPLQSHVDGLHTFTFSKNKVSISDAGLYTLSVESGLHPGNMDKRLVVTFSVVVEQPPSAPQINIALIAGVSAAGAIVLILIIVFVAIVLKKRNHDKKDGKPDPSTSPPAVVYINVPGAKTEQDHGKEDQVDPNQQVVPATYENVHQYTTIGPKSQDGDDDPYVDFNI